MTTPPSRRAVTPPLQVVEVMVCSFSYLPCLQGGGPAVATSKRSLEAPTEAGAETVAERSEVGGVKEPPKQERHRFRFI